MHFATKENELDLVLTIVEPNLSFETLKKYVTRETSRLEDDTKQQRVLNTSIFKNASLPNHGLRRDTQSTRNSGGQHKVKNFKIAVERTVIYLTISYSTNKEMSAKNLESRKQYDAQTKSA